MTHRDNFFLELCYHVLRFVLGPLVRLIWIKEITGLHHIPPEGSVIVAFNHQSYFDFICFVAICPRHVHYLSAEKFFTNPFWHPIMKITGQIRVERRTPDKRILHETIHSHLDQGKAVGIFPEGTRSPHQDKMLEAFSGVARYAFHKKVPVVPVGIKGAYEVMSRFDKKPKFKKNIEINIGPPIDFSSYQYAKMNKKSFKILTNKIMVKISELSGKSYPYKLYPPWPKK
ncbi:MAG: lysophospholipid acyltransferase family protein [Patescibacteria group bacterium]